MGTFKIRFSSDLIAGLFFALIGLATCYGASRYNLGSAARMGPGFMPMVIGTALTLFGALGIIKSMLHEGEEIGTIELRPAFLVFAGVFLFAMLIERGGFLLAIAALVVLARLAGEERRLFDIAVLALALALLGAAIFVWGLGMPLRLWPR
jgi:preprotein translocase subunit Sec61beta